MLRVQRRTPWQRVAKNHDVRRQLRRPRSVPLSQYLARQSLDNVEIRLDSQPPVTDPRSGKAREVIAGTQTTDDG